jgi:uncharacterized membrane protein YdbT with pleckstrin-like domain
MQDRSIRPTMKTVWVGYFFAAALVGVIAWLWYRYASDYPIWGAAPALVLFIAPIRMHLKRFLIGLHLHDGHLTVERGFFSRTRRTLDIAKIQDVTVSRTFWQRMLGTGDLRLESAGESGAVEIANVDKPKEIADEILAESKRLLDERRPHQTF